MASPNLPPPSNLPTRVPRKASEFAARLWAQGVGERIQLLINPSPETAADFIRAGIESFDIEDLLRFVRNQEDLLPHLREWMKLENPTVKPWAQTIIRIWWPQIFAAAMSPSQLLDEIAYREPLKAKALDTEAGRVWFDATVFNLITFFRQYAGIQGDGVIEPPPNFPERMKRKALAGAGRVLTKIQAPQK